MRYLKILLLGILAGIAIGLGGFVFVLLASNSLKFLGSLCFSIGLFLVCSFSLMLYTGKIGYLVNNLKIQYGLDLIIMLIGNIGGACGLGYLLLTTKITDVSNINTFLNNLISTRTNEDPWSAIKGGFMCGIFVFLAVYLFKKKEFPYIIRLLSLVVSVTMFVYFGFEHCIANCFYYSFINGWNTNLILNILYVAIGNSVGAIFTCILMNYTEKLNISI